MHEQKNNTPVIVLTGEGSEHIAVEAMKLGAYAYLQKGTADMNELMEKFKLQMVNTC